MTRDPFASLSDLARAVRSREVSPVEVTEATLDRIDRLDGRLQSFSLITRDLALKQARKAEAEISTGQVLGPLHGVPVAVKDNCFTRGIPTTNGLAANDQFLPRYDSTVVAKLRVSGAVMLGKLRQTEGAFAEHRPDGPVPVNPWAADRWSGISSSGAGVAVAAGLCFGAIGTDSGGSIRLPAAANRLVGLKPTWGRVSRYGVFENAASLDHIGPLARTVEDAGILLGAIAGRDPNDPTSSTLAVPDYMRHLAMDLSGIRIGVDERYNSESVDAETGAAVLAAVDELKQAGARIHGVDLSGLRTAVADWRVLKSVETATAHRTVSSADRLTYGESLLGLIAFGERQSGIEYFTRMMRRLELRGRLEQLFESVDLLLTPAMAHICPTAAEMNDPDRRDGSLEALVRFTVPFNFTGHPCLVLPGGEEKGEMSISFQLVAAPFDEARLLSVGHAYQCRTSWHAKHPDL